MGWLWNCFGRKSERFRRTQPESRTPPRNNDKSGIQAPSPNLHSLGAQIRTPHEATVYEEPFQPKQVVSGAPHGSKLFKRKSVRRAKSCGSSTAFENGAKRLFDKYAVGHIDRLQEEVEGLRKRLAQEEEEAQKLRHEVSYLRSCGVLQSPDRHRNSGNFEKDSSVPKEEKSQNWQSWLGLTLSPASRFKLEEQLRCLAADEMSKVPDKGLTNGQKALLVATKLWRTQSDPEQDSQNKNTVMISSSMSYGDVSNPDNSRENQLVHTEGADTSEALVRRSFDRQLTPTNEDVSFREHLQFGNISNTSEASESGSPVSVSSEIGNFSFHPSVDGDTVNAKVIPVLQRTPSRPESMMTSSPVKETGGKSSGPVVEKFESPKKTNTTPSTGGSGSQNADLDHVQARRFIDLRYQELEEKLLKSPKSESVSFKQGLEIISQGESKSHLSVEKVEASIVLDDKSRSEPEDFSSSGGYSGSPSLTSKPYFACKSGRLWQPLSPVREVDSGRSSREEGLATNASQFNVSDSADSSNASDLKSSLRTIISASKWEQGGASRHSISSEVHDDDLFTLSPRRLHHSYNPWDHPHRSDDEVDDEHRVDLSENSRPGARWASNGEVDEDLAPIQCQSPSFSPKQKFKKSKFVEGRALKVDDYARDKYFKEMGFNLDEFLFSSDSCISMDSAVYEKENQDEGNIEAVTGLGTESSGHGDSDGSDLPRVNGKQLIMAGPPLEEAAMSLRKSLAQDDVTLSEDTEHPVLSSIENLPKVVEYQGVSSTPIEYQENHVIEDVRVEKGSPQDKSSLHFSSEKREGVIRLYGERRQVVEHEEEPIIGTGNRKPDNSASPLELPVRQDIDMASSPVNKNADGRKDNGLRLSLRGFAYEDDDELHLRSPTLKDNLLQSQQAQQKKADAAMDEVSQRGRSGELHNYIAKLDENGQENISTVQSKDGRDAWDEDSSHGQSGQTCSSHSSNGETMSECQSKGIRQKAEKKVVRLDNDVKNDVLFHTQSLGYSIQIPKFKESFSDTENAFESSSVGGDSELSRDGDETFHDCESPTPSENIPESAESIFSLSETPNEHYFGSSKPRIVQDELNPSKRTLDISPDDRPILGTVATHWGDGSDPKCQREWDGLGIPNSTSKFKEDQRVSFHTTPFETRLEQALAKLPIVPELHNQRRLFEGVAMM